MMVEDKPGTPAELVHYGKKGMKWGVRQGYAERHRARAKVEKKVGKGGGTASEKFRVHATTSAAELGRAGGIGGKSFRKAALTRGREREAHVKRIETGKAKTLDLVALYADVRLTDIRRKK